MESIIYSIFSSSRLDRAEVRKLRELKLLEYFPIKASREFLSSTRRGMSEDMNLSVNGQYRVPPGFRFHPTEEELLHYYLTKKVASEKIDLDVIRDVDLNKLEPWDIQGRQYKSKGVGRRSESKVVGRQRKSIGVGRRSESKVVGRQYCESKVVGWGHPSQEVKKKVALVGLKEEVQKLGRHTSKVVKEKAVVGLREEVEKLLEKLVGGGDKPLEIISIIGPGGGGKTTLAREVYDDPLTLHTFEICAWIDVSQDYNKTRKRDLLIRILDSVSPGNYEKSSDDDKLGEDILKCLKGQKYLIVMDDIWGIEAWHDIQRSFPKEYKGSKVLFTSRLLVELDNVEYVRHFLAPLPKIKCWELLQEKVFGKKGCPPELVNIGKRIAEKCKGLPLAVVTIAGILATEDKTPAVWRKVAQHLSSIIAKNQEGCMEILELSYNDLPLHLKACFLYIGGYPENKEIPIRELIWLWIAEGFIHQSEGEKSLETIAKDYLNDLISRSLIQVARKSPLGEIKACCIHDLLRELCLKKAEDDNFLVKFYEDNSFSPSVTNHHRRLFIGRQVFEKFSLRPRNLRSFLCLSLLRRYESLVETNLSFFVKNFELLRVLSFKSAACQGKIGIGHLVHLRYLAYTLDKGGALPFSYLLDLETLNLDFRFEDDTMEDNTIQLPRNIFKMVKLRHLYTKKGVFNFHLSPAEARSIGLDHSSKLDSLQTLHQVCACETCRSLLAWTPNLRKLGLYGGMLPEDNVLRFPDLDCLKCLEKLTFTTEWISDSSRECTLPPGLKLPLTITQITLKYTCLKWEELSLLETLPCLEVLKLLDYACSGRVWNTSELEGFPQLKYLRFDYLDIEQWIAFEDQFPKLEVLVLKDIQKLERIPIDFGKLGDLQEIMLVDCEISVEDSARKIQAEQRNTNGDGVNLTIHGKQMCRVRK